MKAQAHIIRAAFAPPKAATLGFMLIWLTLAVRVIAPPGLMLAPPEERAGAPAIVICTSEGAKTVSTGEEPAAPNNPHGGLHDCALSALGAGFTPPAIAQPAEPLFFPFEASLASLSFARPGLGLAAPPPPATGPPALI